MKRQHRVPGTYGPWRQAPRQRARARVRHLEAPVELGSKIVAPKPGALLGLLGLHNRGGIRGR